MEDTRELVDRLGAAYATAVFEKDVDELASLYADDVIVFDMWGAWSYDGLDAWRGMLSDWLGSLGRERVGVEFGEVQTVASDGLVVAHGSVTYKGLSADGEVLRSLVNRQTWVIERRGEAWKIVHEHSSGPIDFESGKVILERTKASEGE